MSVTKTGFCSGSDVVMAVGGTWNATTETISGYSLVGHSNSCSIDITNTFQDIQAKPTDPADRGIHKKKKLIDQSITLSVSGFHVYNESQAGVKFFLDKVCSGESFLVFFMERTKSSAETQYYYKPFYVGYAVIENAPLEFSAGTTVAYTITMLADGQPLHFDATDLHNYNVPQ